MSKKQRAEIADSAYDDMKTKKKKGKKPLAVLLDIILVVFVLLVGFFLVIRFGLADSALRLLKDDPADTHKTFSLYESSASICRKTKEDLAKEIKSREPVYVIDVNTYVAPKPDPAGYDSTFDNYTDPTISVHHTVERMYDSNFHFIEVRIKHPSQFRMALANDRYDYNSNKKPHQVASEVNAVALVNGCYYTKRIGGVMIYKGQVLRIYPFGLDILLIDSDGNFHIMEDRQVKKSKILEEYDIISSVSFGPELVRDGTPLKITKWHWQPDTLEPRTAICQYYDDLHYLICLAEGRSRVSVGVKMETFAKELAAKGVRNAYNLDGGQTGTIVIGGQVKNVIGWGPEKEIGDFLYFATAKGVDDQN